MNTINLSPIGYIHSPFSTPEGTPIQPAAAKGIKGHIVLNDEFLEGLKDLDGFSHIILIYYLHLIKEYKLSVKPFMDDKKRGVFATRAPSRPNKIGLSVVKLKSIEKNILNIEDIDILDNTPLLDIKPYVSEFEQLDEIRTGWLEKNIKRLNKSRDDGRFI